MNGFQVTFFTEQGRRHGHQQIQDWLMETGKSLGIKGITMVAGSEGTGRTGKLHSAGFFELADQPIEITMVLSAQQCEALFEHLGEAEANVFYTKTPVEYGVLGQPDPD
jgi:PII-like signaling protein